MHAQYDSYALLMKCKLKFCHFIDKKQAKLTEVSDVPHGVNAGVTFVENDEQWRSGDAFCQRLTVQILPKATEHFTCYFN